MHRIWALQYLRAIAALGVIVFHVLEGTSHRLPIGAAGVDVFFVLSGFVMAAISARRPIGPGSFMVDRLTRIAPIYWVATIATVLLARALPGGIVDVDDRTRTLITSLLFVPLPNAEGFPWPSLFVGWTLNYEIFFYATFAIALLAPAQWRMPLLATALGAFAGAGQVLHPHWFAARFYTDPIILEFAAGAVMGTLFSARAAGRLTSARCRVGVIALLAAMLPLHRLDHLAAGIAATLLVALAVELELEGRMPRLRVLRLLGDASYSIYLFQVPAFVVLDRLLQLCGAVPARVVIPLDISAAVALGLLVHVAIERPLTDGVRRLSRARLGGGTMAGSTRAAA